ncbi:MAG TPA: redoxin domain-containing protein [Ramlibacter sp.]|nr:redoxin domain-containing protein [Ramlibacter sp.]
MKAGSLPGIGRRTVMLGGVSSLLLFGRGAMAAPGAFIGAPAPAFTALDAAGRPRSLSEFAGKTVVLEWTSPSCPFVRAQYASGAMQALQQEAAKRGVVWLSVLSTTRSRRDYLAGPQAEDFIRKRGAVTAAVLMDADGAMGRAYGARTTPHMFVIAPTGNLAYMGAIDDKPSYDAEVVKNSRGLVRAALDDLAAGRPVATPATRPYGCAVGYA